MPITDKNTTSPDLAEQTVGGLVAQRPSRSRLFERWGIDYCCGGKQRLIDSCAALSIDLQAVLRDLQNEATEETTEQTDWTTAPLSALISHIVTTHHAYLREALPRLSFLTEKVRDVHSEQHPELIEIARIFGGTAGQHGSPYPKRRADRFSLYRAVRNGGDIACPDWRLYPHSYPGAGKGT